MAPILSENSTLALLLGASEYPDADDLSNPAFERSARAFRSYLLNSLKLNERNIFYHFNEDDWPGALEDKVSKWIKTRKSETNAENIFLYYVGHGIAKDRTFYMTIRKSCKGKEDSHCLSAKVLRKALYESGPGSCFWVILDCCYSASAFADFQDDGPRGGAVLYASASSKVEAKAPAGEDYTRFSSVLLDTLRKGIRDDPEFISFGQLNKAVEELYKHRFPDSFVRPQLLTPSARDQELTALPLFPNPSYRADVSEVEYYTRSVRRHGIPEGIRPITEEQAKRQGRCVRITRQRGRVRKLETINGAGVLTPDIYSEAYLLATPRSSGTAAKECRWEFFYDEAGRVALEEISNAAGRVINRCAYSISDSREVVAHYFLTSSEISRPQTKSGVAFIKIVRDDKGFSHRLEYFDGANLPQPDEGGSFGREIEVNTQGLEIRAMQIGRDREPVICKAGYAITESAYDSSGNIIAQSYFDLDGTPVLHTEGYHKAIFEWSRQGNWGGVRLFDLDGLPVLSKSGFASWTAEYDAHGNMIRQHFFDTAGNATLVKEGVANWIAEYDERGRMTLQRYQDGDDRPCSTKDGIVEWRLSRRDTDRCEEIEYLDADGNRIANRSNIGRMVRRYDDQENVVEETYFAVDGTQARNTDGFAGQRMQYDSAGNCTEIVYLGPDNSPTWNNEEIARISRSYDNRYNIKEECYFGPQGSPTEGKNGHHRIVYTYDAHSNLVSTRYFDAAGQPALMDRYAEMTAEYDENTGMRIREGYLDSDGKPARKKAGYAIEERVYNRLGRQVEQRFRDIDGTPVRTLSGYAGWKADYDARGNCIRKQFLDIDDSPAISADGYAAWTAAYDQRGNTTEVRYFGRDGLATLNADGVAGWNAKYDQYDNQKMVTYISTTGEIACCNEGFASWVVSYDQFGNKVEERYLDALDRSVAIRDGVARKTWTYNTQQKRVSERYWGTSGEPILTKQGFVGWIAKYDDRGNRIERTFLDPKGDPTVNKEGYSCSKTEYDERGRPVKRQWIGISGESRISYDEGGNRVETIAGELGSVISTFDRRGNHIGEEYLAVDGTRTKHLDKDLAFSFWKKEYDAYGRMREQRYYDEDSKLFRRLCKKFDPAGRDVGTTMEKLHGELREVTRTCPVARGTEVETKLSDASGNPVTDRFGRSKWLECFDPRGNRLEVHYFDVAGNPTACRGHRGSTATYDSTDRLVEASYEIVLGADEVLTKTFHFPLDRPAKVNFPAVEKGGATAQHNAYVLEYSMKEGDKCHYDITSEYIQGGAQPITSLVKMRQQCCEVTADRRYVVGADLLAGDVGWEADAFAQLRMLMTRSGEIVECSEPTRAIAIPFPTHPIFVGETWKKETKIPFENPFTHILDIFPLEYTYELADVIGERHATARIYASCPQFEFGLGHGASLSISARAVTHFDIHRGLLLRSNVESISVIRIGREKTETLMKIAIVLEPE